MVPMPTPETAGDETAETTTLGETSVQSSESAPADSTSADDEGRVHETEEPNQAQTGLDDPAIAFLRQFTTSEAVVARLLKSRVWLENFGGIEGGIYWRRIEQLPSRDEAYLIMHSLVWAADIGLKHNSKLPWIEKFQVVAAFFLKPYIQSVCSIDRLVEAGCYADALGLCRAVLSRGNLILLFSFEPQLYEYWLREPQNPCFLESHVQSELENRGVTSLRHYYNLLSEISHGHYIGLRAGAFFEKGLFPKVLGIYNYVYVLLKFFLAIPLVAYIQVGLYDPQLSRPDSPLKELDILWNAIMNTALVQGRFDHLQAIIVPERHWQKVGKDKVAAGGMLDFVEYIRVLKTFHPASGKPKPLGKEYQRLLSLPLPTSDPDTATAL